jgi:predicted Zn finger-like uncharacterized protein
MRVQCSACKSNYNIRDDKIPAAGARMKCPRCQKIIEVARPAIIQNIPEPQPTIQNTAKAGRARSASGQYTEKKAARTWAILSATVVGLVLLCLALGIPIKNDKKPDKKETPRIVMPFNFANDKLAEFIYFIETMEQKWGAHPADLLNLRDYPAPDEYGDSQYGVEENGLIVEFFFFFNQLYQSTINTLNTEDANIWIEYLDSHFDEKQTDGKFYIWRNGDLNIVYVSESGEHLFHFRHRETFAQRQEYIAQFGSKLAKFEVFNKIIDNEMNWAVTTDRLPGISLHQKTDAYKWSEYSDDNATNLYYKFFQDRLCRVDILVLDSEQATKMQGMLENKFGGGEINPDESITWVADEITITTFNYLKGKGFAFTHNETLKAKEEYAKNVKPSQKEIALKEKRKKEALLSKDGGGSKNTMREDKVEDSLKRIAGQRAKARHRYKFSSKSRRSTTPPRMQRRVSVASANSCWAEKEECLSHCAQALKFGPRTKMYKGEVRTCSAVCYEGYRDCSAR